MWYNSTINSKEDKNMRCPYCGAETKGNICEYCGSELPKEKETTINITNNYYTSGNEPTNIDEQPIKNQQYKQSTPTKKKKSRMWLWVLGWIFIFPVPLTILMLRRKEMKPALKYGIIAISWLVYIVIGLSGNSDETNSTSKNNNQAVASETVALEESKESTKTEQIDKEKTESTANIEQTEQKDQVTEKSITYDSLQNVFLAITTATTEDDVKNLINEYGIQFTSAEYNGTPKKVTYKLAYDKDVAIQSHAAEGDYMQISFSKEDGTLLTVEYFNSKSFMIAVLYNYGTYWSFREKEPNNSYTGYYYYKPGDTKGGITITYSNGNSTETGYYSTSSVEEVLVKVM